MSIKTKWISLATLAGIGLYVGLWATLWPEGFFDAFPGFGRTWVSSMPPYNEHLTRDVGGMYLALSAVSLAALARPRADTMRLAGLGWVTFNIAHSAFHLTHLAALHGVDRTLNVLVLVGACVLASLLLLPTSSTSSQNPRAAD